MKDKEISRMQSAANIAVNMKELAAGDGTPLEQDEELTMLLKEVPDAGEIPDNVYTAAAEVLSYLYDIEQSGS